MRTELNPSNGARIRAAYTEFLLTHPWEVFLTLTFDRRYFTPRYGISPEKADKDFRRLIRHINEQLEGPRWMSKSTHKGVIWARTQETHADGVLHYHACIYSPSTPIGRALVDELAEWWGRKIGSARVEVPRSVDDVARYLTKHMGDPERAEMDFSYNFLMRR
ncbi:hypothetical protein QE424_001532 [Stenotrophomonas rhizophila]|uniref:Replication-associated protein ORF2/G2P domain-containing protein n=1 Tax=Stenotrophomonas rhizophila TaxID=216778 RepID=A0AAP5AIX5_9GAMM|nr:hypothetical protein [Stenotrophomonas rhizophila]MDQ1108373.1 hypothetical protein [Stenotrophomonas rhizophila]